MLYSIKRSTGKMVAGVSLFCLAQMASAALISGDFRTESNLPDIKSGSPLIYQSLNQTIGAGYELNNDHFVENPDDWGGGVVWMDYNPANNILTLDSQDTWDFKTFDAWISEISFTSADEYISGISLISDVLTTPSLLPALSFTANSLHISYNSFPETFDFTGGTATFQIETQVGTVSVPGSLALLGLGLVGLSVFRKKSSS